MSQKRALLTGVTGFIGSHLARRLLNDGWDVHAVVRVTSDRSYLRGLGTGLNQHGHDGTTENLMQIMSAVRPQVVFHLASLFLSQHKSADIEPLIKSNLLFGTQLLEAMTTAGIDRLVNTGTSWQHNEGKAYSPVNLYAATKQAFETLLRYYLETTPLKAITLKLFDTYGPGDRRPKLLSLLQKTAAQQEQLLMSPGEQLIDLVYIDDVINAFLLAGERLQTGSRENHETYVVSSGRLLTLKELVAVYEQVIGKKLPIVWGGLPYRPREVMVPWNTGTTLPGWTPRIDLETGIRMMKEAHEG